MSLLPFKSTDIVLMFPTIVLHTADRIANTQRSPADSPLQVAVVALVALGHKPQLDVIV